MTDHDAEVAAEDAEEIAENATDEAVAEDAEEVAEEARDLEKD